MHNPDAELVVPGAALDEFFEPRPGFGQGHAVKIDLSLNRVATASQHTHCRPADGCSLETQYITATLLEVVDIRLKTLGEYGIFVCLRKSGLRLRFSGRPGDTFVRSKGPGP